MKPRLFIGKFAHESALRQLLPNVNYSVFVTSLANVAFWQEWFPDAFYCSHSKLKRVIALHIINNGVSNFIIDAGDKKISQNVAKLLSAKSIAISKSLKTGMLRFHVIDDEVYNGFRVPVFLPSPPSYNDINPPLYVESFDVSNIRHTLLESPPCYES